MPRTICRALLAVLLLLAAAACASDAHSSAPASEGPSSTTATTAASGTVAVLAASSLTDALTSVAAAFETRSPGVHVALTFDGSSRLATEILEGVPADVFVSADEDSYTRVAQGGGAGGDKAVVASNELQIVVPAGNPRGIAGLRDLTHGIVLALCRPEVPCGAYAARAFALAGVEEPRAGEEDSVKAVLTKVQLGEADAGVVYRTDVQAARGVTGVDLPPAQQVRATYPASVLAGASNPGAAAAFVEFLQGAEAQRILARAGFGPP
jgi:molybdate transport system substrate-binding protein